MTEPAERSCDWCGEPATGEWIDICGCCSYDVCDRCGDDEDGGQARSIAAEGPE